MSNSPSSSLHFYCQALLSLGFLCFAFPVVRIFALQRSSGKREPGRPSQLLFPESGTPLPQVTIAGLTDVSHPAGEKAAGGKLSFPFQPSAPTAQPENCWPLLLLHLGNGPREGRGGGGFPAAPLLPSGPKIIIQSLASFGI